MAKKMEFPRHIVLFVVITLLISTFAQGGQVPQDDKEPAKEPKWYEYWERDKNHNKIDDLIETLPSGERFGIFINYDRLPTESDVKVLSRFDFDIKFVYKYIEVICARNVVLSQVKKVAKLPHVVMVKLEPEIKTDLQVSARAIQARQSDTYSPNTAFDLGITGQGINIAILDSGVDDWGRNPTTRHESVDDFDDNPTTSDQKFVAGVDFTQEESFFAPRDGSYNPDDIDGHGTHVASTALGTGGESEYVGAAPGAGLVDVKVIENFGTTSSGNSIAGIEWCIEHKTQYNIRVLSCSYGSVFGESDGTDEESRAVNRAVDAGLVVVVAIGNDGRKRVTSPAAADGAIAVGSVNDHDTVDRGDDTLSSFTNSGPRQDDGDEDKKDELKPDVVSYGDGITAAQANTQTGYITFSGTSMATPHVSGVVALMLDANPALNPEQVKNILRESAEQRGPASFPTIDPKYNTDYGWGIADAYKAVDMARGFVEVGISIDSPLDSALVSGEIEIRGQSFILSGTGEVASVEVSIDDPEFQSFTLKAEGTDFWNVKWDTQGWNGVRTIYARATSGEYSATTSIVVAVQNEGSQGGGDGLDDNGPTKINLPFGIGKVSLVAALAFVGILAAFIILVVAGILIKRRRYYMRMIEERRAMRDMR